MQRHTINIVDVAVRIGAHVSVRIALSRLSMRGRNIEKWPLAVVRDHTEAVVSMQYSVIPDEGH